MQSLVASVQENMSKLKNVINKRYEVSVERAKAEYKYRSALGREMAIAKLEGMAATSLYDYCRGLEHIAELRCQRDILQAKEDYLEQMVYYYKTEIRIAEGQINAERKGV